VCNRLGSEGSVEDMALSLRGNECGRAEGAEAFVRQASGSWVIVR
jgi:hypothetical protein